MNDQTQLDELGLTPDQRAKVAEEIGALRLLAHESTRVYGQGVIRGLFLLNGGAAVAVLSLVGALYGRADQASARLASNLVEHSALSLMSFAIGILMTIAASGAGYFNSIGLATAILDPWEVRRDLFAKMGQDRRRRGEKRLRLTMYAGVGSCLLSFAAFVIGGWHFYRTLISASHS